MVRAIAVASAAVSSVMPGAGTTVAGEDVCGGARWRKGR